MEDADETYKMCRICYGNCNPFNGMSDLISPCACKGSVKYVHGTCLKIWRYKNNVFKELKTCEQCKTPYKNIGGEHRYQWAIAFLTITIMSAIYLLFTFFVKSLIVLFVTLSNSEVSDLSIDMISYIPWQNTSHHHFTCVMLLMTAGKLIFNPSIFIIFNYLFTFWRVSQFGFIVDKILFVVISSLFLRDSFWHIYRLIDKMHFIISSARGNSL